MAPPTAFFFLVIALIQVSWAESSKCNLQFYQHYEQKGCKPVNGINGCPEKFLCKPLTDEARSKCIHNGKSYKVGESIQETGPCDSCSCELSRNGGAFIECASVDCPDWETQNKSCYMGYQPEACCPKEICPDGNEEFSRKCVHNGKTYRIGAYIETEEPCQSCICTKEWRGLDGPGCSKVNCLTGIDAVKIRRGCLPIYSERSCCYSEIYCDDIYGVTLVEFPGEDEDKLCYYQGRYYDRGSVAYLSSDKYQCITCTCNVPPDFTCKRKACPPKPSEDCKTVYGHCCPNYVCP